MSEKDLLFTGERFLPDCEREIWYEHYHRYAMALHWAKDKVVLDAACGEGYGSHVLAQTAHSVIGVDVSSQAINHAQKTYQQKNLTYQEANVLAMDFADNSFDLVVSFETLEHLAEHEQLIREFKRVLKPEGVLLISTPDKKEYSDNTGFNNEFHVKELYRHEFSELLEQSFEHKLWFGQKLMFSSSIWQLNGPIKKMQYNCMTDDGNLLDCPSFNPVYFIVAASNHELNQSAVSDFYSFTEQSEQIYGHYNAVIRAHIKAEKDCEALMAVQQSWINHPIIGRCIKWFGKE